MAAQEPMPKRATSRCVDKRRPSGGAAIRPALGPAAQPRVTACSSVPASARAHAPALPRPQGLRHLEENRRGRGATRQTDLHGDEQGQRASTVPGRRTRNALAAGGAARGAPAARGEGAPRPACAARATTARPRGGPGPGTGIPSAAHTSAAAPPRREFQASASPGPAGAKAGPRGGGVSTDGGVSSGGGGPRTAPRGVRWAAQSCRAPPAPTARRLATLHRRRLGPGAGGGGREPLPRRTERPPHSQTAGSRRPRSPPRPPARPQPEVPPRKSGAGRVGPGPALPPRDPPLPPPRGGRGLLLGAMAAGAARRARRRVRGAQPAGERARSAEDWWWDQLAPSGSGYHLLQSDSMLLVLPGPGPARPRVHRRAARRAQRQPAPAPRAPGAKARPRMAPAPEPPPGPDPGWGDRIPLEILLQIFGLLVAADGPVPFLGRAARVCRRWHQAASQPALWHTVTLSPSPAGRLAKSEAKAEKKLLASLEWLMPNRFSQLQRLTLIHWKSQVHPVLKLVSESCPRLTFLKLSDCHGVTSDTLIMLAKACPQLHSLDIQHSMVESTAVVSFLEEAGPRMRKLWLTYSSQTTAILGALLGSCCPQLQVLEVSTGINRSSTPLQLPVEGLQKGCPQLQVLRLLNLMWLPKPSGRVVTPGPGFPSLEELCLAGSTCNFVSNEALGRLLHGSPNLRLLDLRGCARITPAGLHDLPCQELEQLHLGLYGTSDRLTLAKEGSHLLTQKWCHTLRELDLSGQGFSEKDLEQALAAFSATRGGSHPALCSVNLRGTRVTPSTVSSVISSCPGLLYLNLESCRCLPRGLKRAYRGQEEVQWCLEQLLTSLPSSS
uniref:F-box/LRR-repeat protein 6 n=4 Tax=Canis lupus TaxID=9612 RepID=A0A8C0M5P2_CANLF